MALVNAQSENGLVEMPLPWHQPLWKTFCERQNNKLLPSTLLLGGGAGIGKRLFLHALAARTLCRQPTQYGVCGVCKNCLLLRSGHHPDAVILDDSSIKVDQVRELIDSALSTPQQGENKVIILGPLESLNTHSANALLKCLEEPPLYAHFFLFSHVPQRILPTIRSRCMIFEAPAPSLHSAREWLQTQNTSLTASQLDECLELASGAPLGALVWTEAKRVELLNLLSDSLGACAQGEGLPKDAFKPFSLDDLSWVLDWLISNLQWMLRVKAHQAEEGLPQKMSEHRQIFHRAFSGAGLRRLFFVLDQTQSLKKQVLQGGNPNVALMLEQWALSYIGR